MVKLICDCGDHLEPKEKADSCGIPFYCVGCDKWYWVSEDKED